MRAEIRIREVKREIRTLGLVVRRCVGGGSIVVGVIFRGGLYLDGIIKTSAHNSDITSKVVEAVKSSPHYPQIRVLLLHEDLIDEGAKIDPSRLYLELMRPLILLSNRGYGNGAPIEVLEVKLGDRPVKAIPFGLRRREAERILMITTGDEALPEPLRVADLISSALIDLYEQKV